MIICDISNSQNCKFPLIDQPSKMNYKEPKGSDFVILVMLSRFGLLQLLGGEIGGLGVWLKGHFLICKWCKRIPSV